MNRQAFIAFLVIGLCVIIPFLYYYRNKNPNPRFRPRFGEMVLVAILAFGLTGGGAIFMASLMGVETDPQDLFKKIEQGASRSGGSPSADELEDGGTGDTGTGDRFDELFGD
jgi:hypothetical protein